MIRPPAASRQPRAASRLRHPGPPDERSEGRRLAVHQQAHSEHLGREPQRQPRLLTAPQALELLEAEATFIAVAARNIANGVTLTQPDLDRLLLAAGRVGWLRDQSLGGAHHA